MAKGTSGIPGIVVRGAVGNVVFQRDGDSLVVRERVRPHDPRTPDQMAARRAIDRAAELWHALDDAEFEAWTAFAAREGVATYRLFSGLTARCLKMAPRAAPPTTPPAGPFFGDAVVVSLSPHEFRRAVITPSTWEATPTDFERMALASPPSADPPTVPPSGRSSLQGEPSSDSLVVLASQPNAAGVVTEVLAQPLANRRRKPRTRDWKSLGFVAFATGSLEAGFPLAAGAWAVAYRFVNARTGQATALAPLGATVVR